jgi:putative ABC transport system permease protein
MAPRDIVRSLSRTSVAIAALMVAVSVIVGVSIMIGSFRQTVTLWLSDTLQADVYLSPPRLTASETSGTLPGDVVETAVNFPGVAEAITTRQIEVALPELNRRVNLHADSGDVSQGQRQYLWQSADLDTYLGPIFGGRRGDDHRAALPQRKHEPAAAAYHHRHARRAAHAAGAGGLLRLRLAAGQRPHRSSRCTMSCGRMTASARWRCF